MANSRIKIKGIDKIIVKRLQKAIETTPMLIEIGEFVRKRNQAFARKGTPLQGAVVGKFPVNYPKPSTVERRKEIAEYNTTHPTYKSKRGNLTITGQLIDGIEYQIKDRSIELFVEGRRSAYRTKDGVSKSNPSNAEVYEHLLSQNRNFRMLGLDEKGVQRVRKTILKFLRRLLRRT